MILALCMGNERGRGAGVGGWVGGSHERARRTLPPLVFSGFRRPATYIYALHALERVRHYECVRMLAYSVARIGILAFRSGGFKPQSEQERGGRRSG